MKKTILQFAVAATFVFSFVAIKSDPAVADFSDSHGESFSKAIDFLQQNSIVKGYGDGTFKPNQQITRAEFLKIVLEAQDSYKEGCADPVKSFPDVSEDDWFFSYVCYGVNNSIIAGYPDGTFKPNNSINYVEAAKIVSNVEGLELPKDAGDEWFSGFLAALMRERVVPGTIVSNGANITRGQMSEIIWGLKTGNEVENQALGDLPKINSCEELNAQIKKYQKRNNNSYYRNGGYGDFFMDDVIMEMDMAEDEAVGAAVPVPAVMEKSVSNTSVADGAAAEYSSTNVQEFGVDEADIIKNDGSHIFMIKDNTVRIVKAYPSENLAQDTVMKVSAGNFTPMEMYLDGNLLTIIGNGSGDFSATSSESAVSAKMMPPYYHGDSAVKVFVFDVTDRKNPKKLRSVSFDGSYLSSRKIDGVVYLVVNKYNYYYGDVILKEDDLPVFSDSANIEEKYVAGCSDIRYFPNFQDPNYLILAAIDTKNNSQKIERTVVLGSGNEVYASTENMYVTRSSWGEVYFEEDNDSGWRNSEFTEIFKFALDGDNIDFVAKGKAEGTVINQFAMSEKDGYFRIATQKGQAWGNTLASSGVTIFNEDLNETGKVEGIAPGENMKSVRFVGNRRYMVTFKTVDPLFVINLDPQNPKVLGKLKIPGWSDYLHPWGENYLIGFGKEVDESIDADKVHSDNAVYYTAVLGMKLAIYDVSDVENPKELHKEVIGYRGTTSEVLNNHKALLFDPDKHILAFPINVTENKNGKDGYDADIETIFSGAYIYNIDLEDGFTLKGKVSHYDDNSYYMNSGEYFYGDYDLNIQRIIYIGDKLYSISPNVVKALDWDSIKEVNSIQLDEKKCDEIYNQNECESAANCRAILRNTGDCFIKANGETQCDDNYVFDRCE